MKCSILFSCLCVLGLVACGQAVSPKVTVYGESAGEGSSGVHIVRSGETIYAISQRYHLVMDDLAVANNMHAPYMIDVGQRLRLPPPPTYRVRNGDSLSKVARIFAVPTQKMIAVNDIVPPYRIHPGQVLKLPRVSAQEASAGYESVRMISAKQTGIAPEQQDFVVPERKPEIEVREAEGKQKVAAKSKAVRTKPAKRSSSQFLRPVNGKIISSYGAKKGGLHNDGVNILAPRGSPVKAADNGVVVYAGSELKGSGNLVLVRHSDRWMTAYAHLDKITVKRGTVLARGQKLGTVGSTGAVDKPQLHFEVRRGTNAVNPKKYL